MSVLGGNMPDTNEKPKSKFSKILVHILISVLMSVIATLIANIIVLVFAARKARLKETLQRLFPDFNWDCTNTIVFFGTVRFEICYDDGFPIAHPEAEGLLREALLENAPELGKVKLDLVWKPRRVCQSC
jgi:hypothetical protein